MENTNDYTIEVDHFGKCFIWKTDGTYESEHFDNRLNLFDKINQVIDDLDISEDNSISLLENLIETFLPNFPKGYKKSEEEDTDRYYDECDFISEVYFSISDMEISKVLAEAPSIPFLKVFGEGRNLYGNIYFNYLKGKNDDENEESEDEFFPNCVSVMSKKEGYEWVEKKDNQCVMTIVEKENLINQIDESRLPDNPEINYLKKGYLTAGVSESLIKKN
ncbi:MAG: hypothetical protein KBD48_00985 [Candidatus Pacebacteria bacterium]|nr:hypothetical protein [Candidatus Paceibacterota bacterium]